MGREIGELRVAIGFAVTLVTSRKKGASAATRIMNNIKVATQILKWWVTAGVAFITLIFVKNS
jgi:hypothetical protein